MMLRLQTRRGLFQHAACGCAAMVGTFAARPVPAADAPKTTLNADQALEALKQGNAEFMADKRAPVAIGRERRLEIAKGQAPFAVLVGCSDSRVAPEHLFGRGLGELFIVRVAGNTVDQAALGSIEYGVAALGCPLVVVLGHERCGAVEAAIKIVEQDAKFPGSISQMVAPIIPAVLRAKRKGGGDLLNASIRENVLRVVEQLSTESPVLAEPGRAGKLKVAGAVYSLQSGQVEFIA